MIRRCVGVAPRSSSLLFLELLFGQFENLSRHINRLSLTQLFTPANDAPFQQTDVRGRRSLSANTLFWFQNILSSLTQIGRSLTPSVAPLTTAQHRALSLGARHVEVANSGQRTRLSTQLQTGEESR